ncbi:tetratricopeptide repeat protein [Thermodesulfobacteriota bacterium]
MKRWPTLAADAFEKLIRLYPDYAQAYYYLGETYGRLEKLNYAHFNLGVYYKMTLDYKNAAFHLEKALKTTDDPEKKIKIEVMLIEIRKAKKN